MVAVAAPTLDQRPGGASRAGGAARSGGDVRSGVRGWPTLATLALVLASSYRWRTRAPSAAVSGAPDLAVALEVAVHAAVGAGCLLLLSRHRAAAARAATATLRPPAPLAFGAAYTALVVLSVTYAPYPAYAAVRAAEAGVVLLLALTVAALATRAQLHGAVHGFLVAVTASVAYGVALPSPPVSALQAGRFTWLALHPTVSSVFTALALVMALAYAVGDRSRPGPRWPRGVYAALALAAAGALVASQTRGSALGAAAGALVVALLVRSGRQRVLVGLGLLVVGGLALVATGDRVLAFATRGEDAARLATLNSRTGLWAQAWQVIVQQPLYGHGVGSPRGLFFESTGLGGSHDMVVNVLVEVGAVGLAAWSALVLAVVLQLRRRGAGGVATSPWHPAPGPSSAGDDRPLLAGVLAAVLVSGVFYDGPGAVATVSSVWLFVIAGWLAVLRRRRAAPARAPARAARRR